MYKVQVNEHHKFEIEADGDHLKVNGEVVKLDSRSTSPGHLHIIYKNKSYHVETVSGEAQGKKAVIKVNGNTYQVEIEDQYDQLLKNLGMSDLLSNKLQEIKAPMPGLVLNVLIQEGQEIKKGDSLFVLEAMKMENLIKSTTDGLIKKISIGKGDKVEKGQTLIQFV